MKTNMQWNLLILNIRATSVIISHCSIVDVEMWLIAVDVCAGHSVESVMLKRKLLEWANMSVTSASKHLRLIVFMKHVFTVSIPNTWCRHCLYQPNDSSLESLLVHWFLLSLGKLNLNRTYVCQSLYKQQSSMEETMANFTPIGANM